MYKQLLWPFILAIFINNGMQKEGWRAIKPLHSTCKNVQLVFGGSACQQSRVTYNLPDEVVKISFASKACHPKWPYERWNVPAGTVVRVSVTRRADKPLRLSDLGVKPENLVKRTAEDMVDYSIYSDSVQGISFMARGDKVLEVELVGTDKDKHLLCPHALTPQGDVPEHVVQGTSPVKVAEYKALPTEQEVALLDMLAAKLIEEDSRQPHLEKARVYLIAYAGRQARINEAQLWLNRVADYLVKKRGIAPERIINIDGGYRRKPFMQLFIRPNGTPKPSPVPTVHPDEVELIR